MTVVAGLVAFAYLCGSVPFGLLIVRARSGEDVRAIGSGNIGATNVARAAGRGAAVLTLVLDALKGLGPVLLAQRWGPGAWTAPACAVAAVLGHCFPVWLRFRGGKGVATGLGVSLALAPWGALCGALTWVVFYKLLRISSVGSLAGVAVSVAVAFFTVQAASVAALAVVAAVILVRHTANLQRLLGRKQA